MALRLLSFEVIFLPYTNTCTVLHMFAGMVDVFEDNVVPYTYTCTVHTTDVKDGVPHMLRITSFICTGG